MIQKTCHILFSISIVFIMLSCSGLNSTQNEPDYVRLFFGVENRSNFDYILEAETDTGEVYQKTIASQNIESYVDQSIIRNVDIDSLPTNINEYYVVQDLSAEKCKTITYRIYNADNDLLYTSGEINWWSLQDPVTTSSDPYIWITGESGDFINLYWLVIE